MMLAQLADVPADHLKWFLVILLALATPGCTILGLYLGRRKGVAITGQPIEVTTPPKYVTQDLCHSMHEGTNREIVDLKARVTALERGQQEMLETLDKRMGEFRSEMSTGLRGVHERVDSMPLEVVTLLRNTGAIR